MVQLLRMMGEMDRHNHGLFQCMLGGFNLRVDRFQAIQEKDSMVAKKVSMGGC